jgi:hypothetical protein
MFINGEKDELMMKTEIYMLRTTVNDNIVEFKGRFLFTHFHFFSSILEFELNFFLFSVASHALGAFLETVTQLWIVMEYMDLGCLADILACYENDRLKMNEACM